MNPLNWKGHENRGRLATKKWPSSLSGDFKTYAQFLGLREYCWYLSKMLSPKSRYQLKCTHPNRCTENDQNFCSDTSCRIHILVVNSLAWDSGLANLTEECIVQAILSKEHSLFLNFHNYIHSIYQEFNLIGRLISKCEVKSPRAWPN